MILNWISNSNNFLLKLIWSKKSLKTFGSGPAADRMKKRQEILQGSAALYAVLFVKHNAAKDPTKEKLLCQTQPKEAGYALCFTGPCIDFRRFFHCGLTALIAIDPPKADTVFGPFHQGKGRKRIKSYFYARVDLLICRGLAHEMGFIALYVSFLALCEIAFYV
jgi:hypothetical protein